jgi:hypothetical protein
MSGRKRVLLLSVVLIAATALVPAPNEVALGGVPVRAGAFQSQMLVPYPDTAKGLKQLLKDMRELARSRKLDQLRAMIADLKFPDARAWYLANYGAPGSETADYYEKELKKSQQRLADQMVQFAHEDGYFSVKKQNAKKVFPHLIASPEIFLAAWELSPSYAPNSSETPFGYFVFVDGNFRWESSTMWVTVD